MPFVGLKPGQPKPEKRNFAHNFTFPYDQFEALSLLFGECDRQKSGRCHLILIWFIYLYNFGHKNNKENKSSVMNAFKDSLSKIASMKDMYICFYSR